MLVELSVLAMMTVTCGRDNERAAIREARLLTHCKYLCNCYQVLIRTNSEELLISGRASVPTSVVLPQQRPTSWRQAHAQRKHGYGTQQSVRQYRRYPMEK